MSEGARKYTRFDEFIGRFDSVLRAIVAPTSGPNRAYPAENVPDLVLEEAERLHSAGLMRVNHTGEVCAQALYSSQALLARGAATRRQLQQAAQDESAHLKWCETRLDELGASPSRLNAAWCSGSFAIGAVASVFGDEFNLGFVEETERQVVRHLEGHMRALPANDLRSRAIVRVMRDEEAGHAASARGAGARQLPLAVRKIMALQARLMTTLAYRI